ncbi:MAG: adenosine deaminase [Maritimibacter sp.]
MSLKSLPKIELHHHLEGAAPARFIRDLAQQKNMDVSGIFDERGHYKYGSFLEFLEVYEAATKPISRPEDYAKLVEVVLEGAAEEGVIYLETFVSPDFCGGRDVGAWREYVSAMQEAAARFEDITLCATVTCIRNFGAEAAREVALCAQDSAGAFIRGFGLAADENAFHPKDFSYAFDMAAEAGLRRTAHAGEWGGPQSVRDVIDHLKVERIGHGVRAIEDPKLVEFLAASGIVLEVCPGSNLALGVYPDWAAHPIEKLRNAGVRVTVSTDDPPFFHTTMTREYEALERSFGWDLDTFKAINDTALAAAFCDEETRAHLKKKLEAFYA